MSSPVGREFVNSIQEGARFVSKPATSGPYLVADGVCPVSGRVIQSSYNRCLPLLTFAGDLAGSFQSGGLCRGLTVSIGDKPLVWFISVE